MKILCHFHFLLRLPQLDRNQQLGPFRAKPARQSERVVDTRFARVKAQKCREKVGAAGGGGRGERQPLEWNEGQDTLVSASIYSLWIVSAWQPAIKPNISREECYGGCLTRSVHQTCTIGGHRFRRDSFTLFPVDDVSWDKIVSARSEIQARWIRSENHVQHVYNTCSPNNPVYFCNMNFFLSLFIIAQNYRVEELFN